MGVRGDKENNSVHGSNVLSPLAAPVMKNNGRRMTVGDAARKSNAGLAGREAVRLSAIASSTVGAGLGAGLGPGAGAGVGAGVAAGPRGRESSGAALAGKGVWR